MDVDCCVCGKVFEDENDLKRHMKKSHSDDIVLPPTRSPWSTPSLSAHPPLFPTILSLFTTLVRGKTENLAPQNCRPPRRSRVWLQPPKTGRFRGWPTSSWPQRSQRLRGPGTCLERDLLASWLQTGSRPAGFSQQKPQHSAHEQPGTSRMGASLEFAARAARSADESTASAGEQEHRARQSYRSYL